MTNTNCGKVSSNECRLLFATFCDITMIDTINQFFLSNKKLAFQRVVLDLLLDWNSCRGRWRSRWNRGLRLTGLLDLSLERERLTTWSGLGSRTPLSGDEKLGDSCLPWDRFWFARSSGVDDLVAVLDGFVRPTLVCRLVVGTTRLHPVPVCFLGALILSRFLCGRLVLARSREASQAACSSRLWTAPPSSRHYLAGHPLHRSCSCGLSFPGSAAPLQSPLSFVLCTAVKEEKKKKVWAQTFAFVLVHYSDKDNGLSHYN